MKHRKYYIDFESINTDIKQERHSLKNNCMFNSKLLLIQKLTSPPGNIKCQQMLNVRMQICTLNIGHQKCIFRICKSSTSRRKKLLMLWEWNTVKQVQHNQSDMEKTARGEGERNKVRKVNEKSVICVTVIIRSPLVVSLALMCCV